MMQHQRHYARALAAGFAAHGMTPKQTTEPDAYADVKIHVCLGPHYALRYWSPRAHDVLLLDRCFYRGDPEHVSLGWLQTDGGRFWRVGEGRAPLEIVRQWRHIGRIFLADFNGPQTIGNVDRCRAHPARAVGPAVALEDDLRRHHVAIGYRTTALVTAALMGLQVHSLWAPHILNRPNWLELLPYADWSHGEIASGEAWEHLRHDRNLDRGTG